MKTITQSELARELGVIRQRVNHLIRQEKLTTIRTSEGGKPVIVKDKKYKFVRWAYEMTGRERYNALKTKKR